MTDARILTSADLATIFNEVRTERLVLRRLKSGDGLAVFKVQGDPATNLYNPAGPDPDLATSEETLRRWLRDWQDNGYGYWAVTLPHSEDVLGFGGIKPIVWRDRDVLNLYYRFTPSSWGHGYASEMAQTAVTLARAHLSHFPVVARTRPENVAAIRTAERAGLRRRPDLDTKHIVFALGWTPGDSPSDPH
jgi:[ribosomal protein S5]-alanine N-acetyltransferase